MPASEKMALSVLIAARNEEVNIVECIRSVQWADQVYVLDSQSSDRTVELAEAEGAHVAQFHYDGGWPKKRNWGLENLPIQNDWVLLLDADERVSLELKNEIADAIQNPDFNGYYLKWKFIFLGRWMKHSWSHGWMLRLFRNGKGCYEDLGMRGEGGWDTEVHENVIVEGKVGRLSEVLDHHSNQALSFWIAKQNEFSDWNAKRRLDQLKEPLPPFTQLFSGDPAKTRKYLKALFIRMPAKPSLLFLYLYVYKRGFLDGRAGFYFCRLRAMHELNICAKVYEMSHVKYPES
ncbi:MAG: glycosyltransferase involved in cell wall biosynthesis [Candidatus Omnitrophota bacterium]|jgi:glycosyltransferase involved in cell wall biosynthesis